MEIQIIKTDEEFQAIKAEWKTLEEKDLSCSYYSTYDFVEAWWSAYQHSTRTLNILAVFQGNRLVGIAPLYVEMKKKGFLSFKELRLMGRGDYLGFIIDSEESTAAIIRTMMKTLEDEPNLYDRINLQYISQSQSLSEFFFKQAQYNPLFQPLVEVPEIHLHRYETFSQFEKTIPSKTRKYRNKLRREVGYSLHVLNDIDEELYEQLISLHSKQQLFLQEQKGRTERRLMFENQQRKAFYRKSMCHNKRAYVFYLESDDGKILTYNMAYLYNRRLLSWNSAYDPDYESYRLSKVRYYEIFEYLFQERTVDIFDLGAGRYPWKFEWTSDFSMVYELSAWQDDQKLWKFLYRAAKASQVFKGK